MFFCFLQDLCDQASAVLSGSDEKNCNGFVKRQALYACLTCSPEATKNNFTKCIGICLACSNNCHEKHELVELYTKRNFHCDCGIKEGSVPCQLDPTKSKQPNTNSYNQNFTGAYCLCHRPYPDPENPTSTDEMIQCIVCEDWYHSLHLNSKVPDSDAYEEMICGGCMDKNSFLNDYSGYAIKVVEADESHNESSFLNVTSLDESGVKRPAEDACSSEAKKIKMSEDACVRPKLGIPQSAQGVATFWKEGWRKALCKCEVCMKFYQDEKVEFLIDLEDTTHHYEEKGKGKANPSSYDASMEALASLPRTNQIDAISGYNQMKEKLFEFLQVCLTN